MVFFIFTLVYACNILLNRTMLKYLWLQITDENRDTSIVHVSGTHGATVLFTNSDYVRVRFRSNGVTNKKGFRMGYYSKLSIQLDARNSVTVIM